MYFLSVENWTEPTYSLSTAALNQTVFLSQIKRVIFDCLPLQAQILKIYDALFELRQAQKTQGLWTLTWMVLVRAL